MRTKNAQQADYSAALEAVLAGFEQDRQDKMLRRAEAILAQRGSTVPRASPAWRVWRPRTVPLPGRWG